MDLITTRMYNEYTEGVSFTCIDVTPAAPPPPLNMCPEESNTSHGGEGSCRTVVGHWQLSLFIAQRARLLIQIKLCTSLNLRIL